MSQNPSTQIDRFSSHSQRPGQARAHRRRSHERHAPPDPLVRRQRSPRANRSTHAPLATISSHRKCPPAELDTASSIRHRRQRHQKRCPDAALRFPRRARDSGRPIMRVERGPPSERPHSPVPARAPACAQRQPSRKRSCRCIGRRRTYGMTRACAPIPTQASTPSAQEPPRAARTCTRTHVAARAPMHGTAVHAQRQRQRERPCAARTAPTRAHEHP